MSEEPQPAFPVIDVRQVGERRTPTADARELHAFLGVETRYNDWIARRVTEFGFVEGEDFYSFLSRSVRSRMAKELAMVENNERGRQARRHFPVVFARGRRVFANSLDVSRNFGRRLDVSLNFGRHHRHVLDAIRNAHCSRGFPGGRSR